jgi:hypothetical protein
MKIEIEIPDEKLRELANSIMQNYPEYSSPSIQCTSWKYKDGKYKFIDIEEDKTYDVTIDDVVKALPKFIDGVLKNKWKFFGMDGTRVLQLDGGDYDADMVDAIVQLVIFGDVLYG